ncbi:hypothetical protein V1511DRAFT_496222 [Dipodascopsis uninucleata]
MAGIAPDDATTVKTESSTVLSPSTTMQTAPYEELEPRRSVLDDQKFNTILNSDVGIVTLLKRLKQSIVSGKDFVSFLKRRAQIEEEHSQSMKRLSRMTKDSISKQEGRIDSFSTNFVEATKVHEQLADQSSKFSIALMKMHDELSDLCKTTEKARKQLKESGLRYEKTVVDAEQAAEKAKQKYDSLCEEFERVRIGDPSKRSTGLKFKSQKSGPQQEEELHKKVMGADSDYSQKVQAATNLLKDLLHKHRPDTVRQLRGLISSFDAGLSLHLQRFANLTESLYLSHGLTVSPMKTENSILRSMTDIVNLVDNDEDFYKFVILEGASAVLRRPEVIYRQHPSIAKAYNPGPNPVLQAKRSDLSLGSKRSQPVVASNNGTLNSISRQSMIATASAAAGISAGISSMVAQPPSKADYAPINVSKTSVSPTANVRSPSLDSVSFTQESARIAPYPQSSEADHNASNGTEEQAFSKTLDQTNVWGNDYIPDSNLYTKVFGTPLDELMEVERIRMNVENVVAPQFVIKCVEAINKFGLDIEGIYRINGQSSNVEYLQHIFEIQDPATINFNDPSTFHDDIHAVASALKLYFRSLPDPLMTEEFYSGFIRASRLADGTNRRDNMHMLINELPDANYTTLKYLMFHLWHVKEQSNVNRMTINNLATVWGPTLMGGDVQDNKEHAIVIETVLSNCYLIFDADDV